MSAEPDIDEVVRLHQKARELWWTLCRTREGIGPLAPTWLVHAEGFAASALCSLANGVLELREGGR